MYTGLAGSISIDPEVKNNVTPNPQPVAYISNWSIEDTTDVIEITELGKAGKNKKAGLQSWSASADGAVCFETEAGKTGHKDLFSAKHNRQKVQVKLYLKDKSIDTAAAEDIYFLGNGYIESLSVDLSAEDKGNISISISGSGELALYKGGALLTGTAVQLG